MKDVKILRGMTGSPLKDVVKALDETNGNMEEAKEFLRKKGLTEANKRAGRDALQGLISIQKSEKTITMLEFNCETDFVAKTDNFLNAIASLTKTIHHSSQSFSGKEHAEENSEMIKSWKMLQSLDDGLEQQTVEDAIKFVISKVQENCKIGKIYKKTLDSDKEYFSSYIHNQLRPNIGKIGSVVHLEGEEIHQDIGLKIAMHAAAMNPLFLDGRSVPDQIRDAEIAESKGKFKKYVKKYCLYEQELAVVDEAISVGQYLKTEGKGTTLKDFALFSLQ